MNPLVIWSPVTQARSIRCRSSSPPLLSLLGSLPLSSAEWRCGLRDGGPAWLPCQWRRRQPRHLQCPSRRKSSEVGRRPRNAAALRPWCMHSRYAVLEVYDESEGHTVASTRSRSGWVQREAATAARTACAVALPARSQRQRHPSQIVKSSQQYDRQVSTRNSRGALAGRCYALRRTLWCPKARAA